MAPRSRRRPGARSETRGIFPSDEPSFGGLPHAVVAVSAFSAASTAYMLAPSMPDLPPPDAVARLIRSRRTVHLFEPDTPPEEVILRGLDLARWAPNHRLTEPWRFHLLGPETAAAVVELNAELVAAERGASAAEAKRKRWGAIPGWLVVTCRTSADAMRAREDYAACCCAIQNLQLYLWSAGLGMKWTTGPVTRMPEFYDLLGLAPERETVVGLLWYGYAAAVPETQRRPLDAVLTRLP